jgi:uncharacterized repeat protein (TIGR02543 family)
LFVLAYPIAGGTVTLSPAALLYTAGDSVTLTANPAAGYEFVGWSGGLSGSASSDSIVMDANTVVCAEFKPSVVDLTLIATSAEGTVAASAPGPYALGQNVTITASPAAGYAFLGWTGDATGATNPLILAMDSDKTVMATFVDNLPASYSLTALAYPSQGGSLTLSAVGPYTDGTSVSVTALPWPGYAFAGWIGDFSGGGNPGIITMDDKKVVLADFAIFSGAGFIMGQPIPPAGLAATVTGTPGSPGYLEGSSAVALFDSPEAIATDGTWLYTAESLGKRIRKISIATGQSSPIAGSGGIGSADGAGAAASFTGLSGLTLVGNYLYATDAVTHSIRRIELSTGVVDTYAGLSGTAGTTDAAGASARFNAPKGITSDGFYLYVADSGNHTIRKIAIAEAPASRLVTTLAGQAGTAAATDGTGAAARFSSPEGLTTDGAYLYVADTGNQLIRRLEIATLNVSSLAGGTGVAGHVDASGTSARFDGPAQLTTDGKHLYVTESAGQVIRKLILSSGAVTNLAGQYLAAVHADGTGAAARFSSPSGITTDGKKLYVCDRGNHVVRTIE